MPRSTIHFSRFPKRAALALLLAASCIGVVHAQSAPPGPSMPSAEMLATIPSLTTAQQVELRKILTARRDAHEAASSRSHDAFEAQRKKDRAEHERIDDESSARVRALLGDDGFRRYAEWQLSHHGHGPRRGDGAGFSGPHGPRDGKPDGRLGPEGRGPSVPMPGSEAPPPATGGSTS